MVICDHVNPEEEIEGYYERATFEGVSSGSTKAILEPKWDTVSIGIAYADWTFVLYEYFERSGVDYIEKPKIESGYLTLEIKPTEETSISQLSFYFYPLPTPKTPDQLEALTKPQKSTFRVVKPPPPGYWLELENARARVAERWEVDDGVLVLAADISDLISKVGVYQMTVWSDEEDPLPLSQYHLYVEDLAVLAKKQDYSPVPEPTPIPLDELRAYALELINVDRSKHGVPPVSLGNNKSAQIHAEDSLQHGYLGHWTIDGSKPYMLYQAQDGVGVVAENAATPFTAESIARCKEPLVFCTPPSPTEAIAELQWAMMYDDAESDWGHRDTIINPNYDTVNIGIAHNTSGIAFYQHFEYVGVEYTDPPAIEDGILSFRVRPLYGHRIVQGSVYYDPLPEPRTAEEIESLSSYCTGGGFTEQCDGVNPVFSVLMPPELRVY